MYPTHTTETGSHGWTHTGDPKYTDYQLWDHRIVFSSNNVTVNQQKQSLWTHRVKVWDDKQTFFHSLLWCVWMSEDTVGQRCTAFTILDILWWQAMKWWHCKWCQRHIIIDDGVITMSRISLLHEQPLQYFYNNQPNRKQLSGSWLRQCFSTGETIPDTVLLWA